LQKKGRNRPPICCNEENGKEWLKKNFIPNGPSAGKVGCELAYQGTTGRSSSVHVVGRRSRGTNFDGRRGWSVLVAQLAPRKKGVEKKMASCIRFRRTLKKTEETGRKS